MRNDLTVLDDRAVIEVAGPEARDFLQRLITNDVESLTVGEARYGALLTPQGKIVTDFIIVAAPETDRFLLDLPKANAPDLVKKLTLYRLRAKVTITDRSSEIGVAAFTRDPPAGRSLIVYDDPRAPGLWRRAVAPQAALIDLHDATGAEAYQAARIAAGVPEGGLDFAYGDTFPHDANLDLLHGVDFTKGCYVGQEVVSRVEHRGTARKRIVRASFDGPAPAPGADILAGDTVIGAMGSSRGTEGLATVRIDRLDEAADGSVAAHGTALRLTPPAPRPRTAHRSA